MLVLTEYRQILLGTQITVHTYHKNLTFWTMSMQQVLCWRLYLEEFDVTLRYIEGEKNVLADCFSRLPRMSKPSVGDKERLMIERKKGTLVDFQKLKVPPLTDDVNEIMLITTECHDFGFKSKNKQIYNI